MKEKQAQFSISLFHKVGGWGAHCMTTGCVGEGETMHKAMGDLMRQLTRRARFGGNAQ